MSTAYLVDASIYIFRAYFSLPERWHSPDGYPLNAVYGYTLFLLELLETIGAAPVAVAFDESLGSCYRNTLYPGYKASRELPDEALAFQLGKAGDPDAKRATNPYQRVYSELYRKFRVPSYKALPLEAFPAVMNWLTEWWQELTEEAPPFSAGDVGGQLALDEL